MTKLNVGMIDRCPLDLDTVTLLGLANEALTRM